ncbi:MAG: type II 3-dehydroquinate dehydratase [Alphaproteobacteria bacterium]
MRKAPLGFPYILNGPNLNLLGERELRDLWPREPRRCRSSRRSAKALGRQIVFRQERHEALVDWIQEASGSASAIILNTGA